MATHSVRTATGGVQCNHPGVQSLGLILLVVFYDIVILLAHGPYHPPRGWWMKYQSLLVYILRVVHDGCTHQWLTVYDAHHEWSYVNVSSCRALLLVGFMPPQ